MSQPEEKKPTATPQHSGDATLHSVKGAAEEGAPSTAHPKGKGLQPHNTTGHVSPPPIGG